MMLRGCKLKNTDWVIGVVVYTGEDTAIMMNGSSPFSKTSNIERMVNNIILAIFAFELFCSFSSALYGYFMCKNHINFVSYITETQVECDRLAGISFGSYFILYSTFIPISLIVSLEFVKVFQGYFMSIDKEMYSPVTDREMACRTVSINEELGQI
jgi:magnesium-transporting ATPase (P-type)